MAEERDFYDITISEDDLGGNATPGDLEYYRCILEEELEKALDADVRVRYGDGTTGYTKIGADHYTHQGPLSNLDPEGQEAFDAAWQRICNP